MPSNEKTKAEIEHLKAIVCDPKKQRLIGLDEIAAYLDVSIGTVRNLIRKGLPAARPFATIDMKNRNPGKKVETTKSLIDSWYRAMHLQFLEKNHWIKE